jgi:hypothetical protein
MDALAEEEEMDEDELEEAEELGPGKNDTIRSNDGITQGHRKSSNYNRWEPLKGRGRT